MSDMFTLISRYWAEPIIYSALILIILFRLYPLIKRITTEQLVAAIDVAKNFPETIRGLNDATESLKEVSEELNELRNRLDTSMDGIQVKVDEASRKISDLQKLTEDQPPIAAPGNEEAHEDDAENWEEVRRHWLEVKDHIEQQIDNIPDGRVRRKYYSASRYDYYLISNYLQGDGVLGAEQVEALQQMDTMFRSIRNRRTHVTPDLVAEFNGWRNTIIPN